MAPDRWAAYHRAEETYTHALSLAKLTFFSQTLPSLLETDLRKFWRVVNGNERKPIELTTDSELVVPRESCCVVLNSVFSSSFVNITSPALPDIPVHDFFPMDPIVFDWAGICKLIQNMKISSSPGDDGINSKFLKNTEVYSSIILSRIFEQSLESCTLPDDWKVGKVVPLHKSGNTHCPNNYRPISLTSIPCKLMEHVIYCHIVSFLETNSFFSIHQHGFRKNYSCETQLLAFTNDLFSAMDCLITVDCIFIDFSRAFDTVSHTLLLYKLSKLNLDPNILKWIECFLSNRTQFVTANEHNSPHCPVTSGVPQGSVLGPLLFLVYINDLPDCISSSIKLFADDCVIYRKILEPGDHSVLQSDLDNISSWCDTWLMKLNPTKCKSMRISRTSNHVLPCDYLLSNVSLTQVTSYKYLGIIISDNLSWQNHVDYITSNANRSLGYLRRNFSLAPTNLKLLLYKTLVRSKLEYASSVWDPNINSLILQIEAIQNRSARFILSNYFRTASVSSMKTNLGLPDLSLRRKISRLCLFHKIYHYNSNISNSLFLPPSYISSRSDHQYKVGVPNSRTNLHFHSFIPKTCADWNHLPASIASIKDSVRFKSAICNHFS